PDGDLARVPGCGGGDRPPRVRVLDRAVREPVPVGAFHGGRSAGPPVADPGPGAAAPGRGLARPGAGDRAGGGRGSHARPDGGPGCGGWWRGGAGRGRAALLRGAGARPAVLRGGRSGGDVPRVRPVAGDDRGPGPPAGGGPRRRGAYAVPRPGGGASG